MDVKEEQPRKALPLDTEAGGSSMDVKEEQPRKRPRWW